MRPLVARVGWVWPHRYFTSTVGSLSGTGVKRMKDEEAERSLRYPENASDEIWSTPSGAEDNLRLVICRLCSPEQRLFEEGFFDLTITVSI